MVNWLNPCVDIENIADFIYLLKMNNILIIPCHLQNNKTIKNTNPHVWLQLKL